MIIFIFLVFCYDTTVSVSGLRADAPMAILRANYYRKEVYDTEQHGICSQYDCRILLYRHRCL